MALLLVLALAARVLLMPIHLSQDQVEHEGHGPVGQSVPHHDHSTHHHDSDSCSVCQDLLLTKHVGGGPSLAAPVVERIPVAGVEIPRGVKPARFSLATGGARGPPAV